MGLFRSGFLACLVVGLTALAQDNSNAPGVPAPAPGAPDTNAPAPAPIVPPATTPEVDPNALQPGITDPALATPAPSTNAAPKPKKKPAAPAMPTLRGTVGSIDKSAMTIVIHGKSKDETLIVTSKTRIFADNKPAILADAKDGESVVAEYRTSKEKVKEALTLRFGGTPAASSEHKVTDHKASATPAKKTTAKKKKAPAADAAAAPAPTGDTVVTPLPDTNAPAPNPGTPAPGVPAPTPGTP